MLKELPRRVRHYVLVYKEFVNSGFSEAMTYRVHFILLIVMDLLFYFSSLASAEFIFDHVDRIGIWDRNQFLFFISFMLALDHLHMTFVSENFWNFSFEIRTGKLDFNLLRPIGSIFTCFFRYVRPASFLNIFVPWGCLIYFGQKIQLAWTSWVFLPGLIVLALVLLVSLEILISMTMFWTIESWGINFLRIQMQQMSRWPDFIYRYFARKVFTFFIPILLVGSGPVKFMLDHGEWPSLVIMSGLTLVLWWLIRVFWRLGLRNYESASS